MLEELYLGNNKIEVAGCIAIAEALKVNTTLWKLDLQGVRMERAGALALSDALSSNTTIIELVLELDKIPREQVILLL